VRHLRPGFPNSAIEAERSDYDRQQSHERSQRPRNRDALAIVAAFVRFNALKILFTPALDFAIVFQRANVFV
jgi:hypothetical protein